MTTLLDARGVTVRFGGVTANAAVDVSIAEGELVGVIGPNGAGKTTFIDAITGFVTASGTVHLGASDISELTALAASLDRELVAAGWPPSERPFRAHLTVARSDGIPAGADVGRRLAAAAAGIDLRSAADRIVLFESITGGGPARYEPLETAELRLRPASPAQ